LNNTKSQSKSKRSRRDKISAIFRDVRYESPEHKAKIINTFLESNLELDTIEGLIKPILDFQLQHRIEFNANSPKAKLPTAGAGVF
jgi:predicted transcriptional regulator